MAEFLKKIVKPTLYTVALILLVLFGWILRETYQADNFGFASKTFWEWMELLVVPAVLAAAGLWFTNVQKQTELEIAEKARDEDRERAEKARETDREIAEKERETDREIALERQRQQTLENYLDRMKELIMDRQLLPHEREAGKRLARTWTLNVLRELTAKRNRQVIQFLQESELLLRQNAMVDLSGANLSGANLDGAYLSGADLSRANLYGAYLSGADLSEANLSEADLSEANLSEANLYRANLHGAHLNKADLSEATLYSANLYEAGLYRANLSGAGLSGANLYEADLSKADLSKVDLNEVNLSKADLSGADLSNAKIFDAQLTQDILSDDTIMPNGISYLEWKQKKEQSQAVPEPTAEETEPAHEPPETNEMRERLSESDTEDGQRQ